jgi:hypothetical protein
VNRNDLYAVLLLLGAAVLLALPFLNGPYALFPFHSDSQAPWSTENPVGHKAGPKNVNMGDKHLIVYPDLVHTTNQFRQGHVPLWNPHNFAGLPHQAVPLSGTAYPFTALATLMDPVDAIALSMVIHLLLAALFCYIFLRGVQVSSRAALLGGVCWAMSGWMMVHVHNAYFVQAMIWLPLALFAIERILASRPRWALMVLSIAIAMMLLGGFPQTAIVNLYFIGIYTLVGLIRVARQEGSEVAIRRGRFLVFFGILGLLMAAVQLLPTLDYRGDVGHQNRSVENLKADSLRGSSLIHLVAPDFFGNPTEQSRPQKNLFALWLLADGKQAGHVANNYSERSFYVGILALIMALLTPFFRRDRAALTLYVATIVSVLLALGTPLLNVAMKFPAMNFGSPMRITQIAGFALPCLFAMTLDRLLALGQERLSRIARGVSITTAAGLGLIAIVLIAMWVAEDWANDVFVSVLSALNVAKVIGTDSLPIAEQTELALPAFLQLRQVLSIVFGFALASWVVLTAFFHSKRTARTLYLAAFVLVVIELGYYGFRFNQPVQAENLYKPTKGIEFLSSNLNGARFMRFGKKSTASFFVPNTALIYGLNDAQGFRAMAPQSYFKFMRTLEPNPHDVGLYNLDKKESLTSPQLDLLRTKYICSATPISDCALKLVYPLAEATGKPDMYIYENPDCLPRAFLVHDVRVMPPEDTAAEFKEMSAARMPINPFASTVWLEEIRPGMKSVYVKPKGLENVIVAEDRAGRIELDLAVEADGILVLSEQYAKGWHAKITGADGKVRNQKFILRANMTFMALPVRAGDTKVEFSFRPDSFKWGGLLTGLSLIFLLLVPLIGPLSTPQVVLTRIEADGSESWTGTEEEAP